MALTIGKHAPDFTLPTTDGKQFKLSEALSRGPVILAFFKISCPICQYAFPFVQRLYESLAGRNASIIGVSQDNAKDTALFSKTYGVTFPILLESSDYAVSNAYGLTNVPTIFEIDTDQKIRSSSVGWSRSDLLDIYSRHADSSPTPLFRAGEQVAEFKAG